MSEILRQDMEMNLPINAKLDELQSKLQDFIKQDKEKSAEQGNVVPLGVLRQDTEQSHWTGAISLASRINSGELTQSEVESQYQKLNYFFVDTKNGSPKRCGDGRPIEGYSPTDIDWYGKGRGAQLFGGTGGDAIGLRLAKGFTDGATFGEDVAITSNIFSSDFAPGDHIDDHAEGQKTGCGAIDGQARKNDILNDPDKSQTLEAVLTFLYEKAGMELPSNFFGKLKQNAESLYKNSTSYFSDKHNAQSKITEISPNGIEKLIGKHNETSLTLNFVEGTTFDRDRYSSDSDGKIQNFNIDVWAIIKDHKRDTGFVLADQIATALDLTDGSIEVFARIPS